jgi:phenylalanyl-tRNA synthetase beta chain
MICDAKKDVAIAGVMGGENYEVFKSKKNILIESAYFNPSSIRRTSKYLQLSTDASYRFERGTDPENTLYAAERAAPLISEIAGGIIAEGAIDVYPAKMKQKVVNLRLERVQKILGYNVQKEEIVKILTNLGFELIGKTKEQLKINVPAYRSDVEREIDLIEEIARISGYDNIPTIAKISIPLGSRQDDTSFTNELKQYSIALGLHEMINNPLQPERLATLTGKAIKIENPLSLDMTYLRTSLVSGALNVIERNLNRGETSLALFEIGNVFKLSDNSKEVKDFDDFTENENIIFVLTGDKVGREWFAQTENYNFFDIKGLVNSFLNKIALDNPLNDSYNSITNTIYEETFAKSTKNELIGIGGRVKNSVLREFGVNQHVFCFELNVNRLRNLLKENRRFKETLKFPKAVRDFAFIFDKKTSYKKVEDLIKKKSSGLLKEVNVFDIFESEELGSNKKSMAFQLTYFDETRTLEDIEVEKDFENLINVITKKFDAHLRG